MAYAVVVGGTGFIGRQVVGAFAALGHEVVSLSRQPASIPLPPGARSVTADLADWAPADIAGLLTAERPSVIVNAAGGVWNVNENQMRQSNVRLVERLVGAVGSLDWRPRLVHLGSAHEYSSGPPGSVVTEQTPLVPPTTYGRTKLVGTSMVLASVRDGQVDGVALRISNVLGPFAPASSLVGSSGLRLRAARAADEVAVLTLDAPSIHRDFVDVRDVADAVVAAAGRPLQSVVNIGSGVAMPLRTVLETLIEISGVPAEIAVAQEQPAYRRMRDIGDWQKLDVSLAKDILDWTPRRSLADSLRAFWTAGDQAVAMAPR